MVIDNEICMAKWMQRTAATVMLLDYFSEEDDAELKATALARLVANRLSRGATWYSWNLAEDQLTSMIADIMVTAYTSVNFDASQTAIEYFGGIRCVSDSLNESRSGTARFEHRSALPRVKPAHVKHTGRVGNTRIRAFCD
jgi:hypothetical protein